MFKFKCKFKKTKKSKNTLELDLTLELHLFKDGSYLLCDLNHLLYLFTFLRCSE